MFQSEIEEGETRLEGSRNCSMTFREELVAEVDWSPGAAAVDYSDSDVYS